jgi:hypothetical protein
MNFTFPNLDLNLGTHSKNSLNFRKAARMLLLSKGSYPLLMFCFLENCSDQPKRKPID